MTYKKPSPIVNKSENNNSPSNHVNTLFKELFRITAKCDIEIRSSLVYQHMMSLLQ